MLVPELKRMYAGWIKRREVDPLYCPGVYEDIRSPGIWFVHARDEDNKEIHIASARSREKAIEIRDR